MRSVVAGHWKLTTTVESIIKAVPPATTWEVAEEPSVEHTVVVWHLKQTGKVKKLVKWVPCELIVNQKNRNFDVSSSHNVTTTHISWSDCDVGWKVDFTQLLAMTSSVGELRRLQSRTCTEKGPGHWSADRLQLSECWWNHYIWAVHSSNWRDAPKTAVPAAGVGQQNGPSSSPQQPLTSCYTTNTSEVERNGLWGSACPPQSPDLCPADDHFFRTLDDFLQGKHLHSPQEAENAFQELIKSWTQIFYSREINQLVSHWQKWVGCNGSYFD